ncbi:MAG TPA: hypothetical protein ENN09_05195 [Planctomycetes bacterium]|nr:hypothetical protein [Planctomycetota bacterium]
MEPWKKYAVELVFLLTSALTILLILRRPYLYVRLGRRRTRLQTYFMSALLGPVLIFGLGLMNYHETLAGFRGGAGINPLGILALFLSMVFMSIFLDMTGFFEFTARSVLKYARTDGRKLFFALYATVSVLTIFTSNDIIILTFTPFVYYFTKEAKIDPRPYLMAEFFAANTWSMMLYIGNPTNILIAGAFNLDFIEYTRWMLLPTIAAGAAGALALYLLFRRSINCPLPVAPEVKPKEVITDAPGMILGLAVLGCCIVALGIAPYFGLEIWKVALAFASALLVVLAARDSYAKLLGKRVKRPNGGSLGKAFVRMPWTIVPFVLSLFITVGALHYYGVTSSLGRILEAAAGGSCQRLVWLYGLTSALAANALNNIPMTLAFASAMREMTGQPLLAAALSTTIGSNLGANITPIGALAGIMWLSILKTKRMRVTFGEFVKCGLVVTPATLVASLGVLALEFMLFQP